MQRPSILTDIFTDPRPCPLCRRPGPTYTDRETGARYCLPCLEAAVEETEAEMRAEELNAERRDMAIIACFHHQLAA